MKKSCNGLLQMILLVAVMSLAGCAGNQQGYQKAFDSQSSLTQT